MKKCDDELDQPWNLLLATACIWFRGGGWNRAHGFGDTLYSTACFVYIPVDVEDGQFGIALEAFKIPELSPLALTQFGSVNVDFDLFLFFSQLSSLLSSLCRSFSSIGINHKNNVGI